MSIPINKVGRNVGRVNVHKLLRQILLEEQAAGREVDAHKVLAVARKRMETVPASQRSDDGLTVAEVSRARRKLKAESVVTGAKVSDCAETRPALTTPKESPPPGYSAAQIRAGLGLLDACGGRGSVARELLNVLTERGAP